VAEPPAEVQGRIFISYRRDDAAYPAGWLFDRLAERFGKEQIFKDVDSIELGEDFVAEIGEAVGSTDVLLAVIGEKWLTVLDERGGRRLDDPEDFVRIEIEAALRRKVRVIPILVEGASMPREEQLPPSLTALARRQALELSPARFSSDTSKLLTVLERALADARTAEELERTRRAPPAGPPPPKPPRRRRALMGRPRLLVGLGVAAVVLALLVGAIVLLSGDDDRSPTGPQAGPGDETPVATVDFPLAYVSDRTGDNELWGKYPNEAEPRQGTFGFAEVRRPDWSPDGATIVFSARNSDDADNFDLWLLEAAEGAEPIHLTRGSADDGAPSWSPDSTEIAFGRSREGETRKDIWIIDVGSGEERRVTDDPADDDAPSWSSTGLIAFESNRADSGYDIYYLDPARPELVEAVTQDESTDDLFPDWSPDGQQIAYRSAPRGALTFDIFTIDLQNLGSPHRVTSGNANHHHPAWSPDGELIAFDAKGDRQTRIFAVPSAGGEERPLVSGPGSETFPAWSPLP
jgi:Tol biopolymer transport system component